MSEALYRQTLQLKEIVLGKDHLATLRSINNLASLLYQQGRYAEAEALRFRLTDTTIPGDGAWEGLPRHARRHE